MITEECIELLYGIKTDAVYKILSNEKEAIDMAIEALEQEPCEDAISREDALMALTGEWTVSTDELIHRFIKRIKNLPSVTPKEKTGWIPVSERLPEDFKRILLTVVNYNGNKVVRVAEYYDRKKTFYVKETHEEWEVGEKGLLAWMPLPEPYEPQESEDKE